MINLEVISYNHGPQNFGVHAFYANLLTTGMFARFIAVRSTAILLDLLKVVTSPHHKSQVGTYF